MRRRLPRLWLLGVLMMPGLQAIGAEVIHYALEVHLDPSANRLAVETQITLPEHAPESIIFRLHGDQNPRLLGEGATLVRQINTERSAEIPIETYRINLQPGVRRIRLAYEGTIHHPVTERGEEYARSFSVSPGLISADGVFLGGSSYWFPRFALAPYLSFEMAVTLPGGWRSVSQGERTQRAEEDGRVRETWAEHTPQEEIYLVAARFTEYHREGGIADAVVFLRQPDEGLAASYLELTDRYLQMYARLIGTYPYDKFALVENFWETGYGMPSFTLLGPRVIRLPFIPYTSFPHEILHNWWGNGVYVDYDSGNWSEGLTSYLADHLLKEQRGGGEEYRRGVLQKYADYVHENKDFPLTEFRGRHNSVTEAVGYGKTLMVFHMLRNILGDQDFVKGLRRLFADNTFRVAGWSDVAGAFNAVAEGTLTSFFEQWITRPGAPALRLRDVEVSSTETGYRLRAVIEQTQSAPAYTLEVPVAIQLEGRQQAIWHEVSMQGKTQQLDLDLSARPLYLSVDPAFDLFRRLHREEIPPAISQALGGEQVLVVLPSAAPEQLRESYRRLAESWQRGRASRVEIIQDDRLDDLPDDQTVWLLGWENRFRPLLVQALTAYEFVSAPDSVTLAGEKLSRQDNAVVILGRHPGNQDLALGWVAINNAAAMSALARKLPHYGKYSYLGFSGDDAENILKGQWPVIASPLSLALLDEASSRLVLPVRKPLAELPPAFSAARMMEYVERLAHPDLEGRGLGSKGLDAAATYIAEQFAAVGLEPAGDPGDGYYQTWGSRAGDPERAMTLRNVVGMIAGRHPAVAGEVVILGAHYDHLGLGWPDVRDGNAGKIHAGADDNASGVAVLLELARNLTNGPAPDRTILFAAFTGEETERLGSRHYVEAVTADPSLKPFGMINLDTVGRLGEGPLYVLGAGSAREWVHILRGVGYVTGVQVEVVSEPLDASDQASFIEAGIPAVQLFSGAHADYHRPSDTPDRVDARGLTRVASVAREAIDYLAGRDAQLSVVNAESSTPAQRGGSIRRAALGTVPDFAHSGKGVRLSGVTPRSPAERAGLRKGDILVAVDDHSVDTLKEYAGVLRRLAPGDRVQIHFLREGETHRVETQVVKR